MLSVMVEHVNISHSTWLNKEINFIKMMIIWACNKQACLQWYIENPVLYFLKLTTLSHIGRFNKFQRIEIMQNMFSYNSRIQLEINAKNEIQKTININFLENMAYISH